MKIEIHLNKNNKENFEKCRVLLKDMIDQSGDAMDDVKKKKKFALAESLATLPEIAFDYNEADYGFFVEVSISLNIAFRMMGIGRAMRKMFEKLLDEEGVIYDKIKVKN